MPEQVKSFKVDVYQCDASATTGVQRRSVLSGVVRGRAPGAEHYWGWTPGRAVRAAGGPAALSSLTGLLACLPAEGFATPVPS